MPQIPAHKDCDFSDIFYFGNKHHFFRYTFYRFQRKETEVGECVDFFVAVVNMLDSPFVLQLVSS